MWHRPGSWSQRRTEILLPFTWRKEMPNVTLLWKMLAWRYEQDRKPLTPPRDAREGFLWEVTQELTLEGWESKWCGWRQGEGRVSGDGVLTSREAQTAFGWPGWRRSSWIWTSGADKLLKCFNLQPKDFGLLCPTGNPGGFRGATWSDFLSGRPLGERMN